MEDMVEVRIGAEFAAGEPQTKTILSDSCKVRWTPNDTIRIFFETGDGYALISDNDTIAGTASFVGSIPKKYASDMNGARVVYPAGTASYISPISDYITTTMETVQIAEEGTFADNTLVSMGTVNDGHISFLNVCSGLAFRLEHEGLDSVRFSSATPGNFISGRFSAKFNRSGIPSLYAIRKGQDHVTLRPKTGETLKSGVWYYLAFLPFTDTEGISMTFWCGDYEATKTIAGPLTFSKGKFARADYVDHGLILGHSPVLSLDIDKYSIPREGGEFSATATTTSELSITMPSWVSLKDSSTVHVDDEGIRDVSMTFAVEANSLEALQTGDIFISNAENLTDSIRVTLRYGYESTDYSAHLKVDTLQLATDGRGIDVVFMGDAFSDRQIADSTYAEVMQRAYDAFFGIEPFTSFKHLFNAYYITLVSRNEGYGNGFETALNTYFGSGTTVGGDQIRCALYAKRAPIRDMKETTIITVMNREVYAGTAYIDSVGVYVPDPEGLTTDSSGNCRYGSGRGMCFLPLGTSTKPFDKLLQHEANGHAFAKFADEYYTNGTSITPQLVSRFQRDRERYGWWKNVDFTTDSTAVSWSKYLKDPVYAPQTGFFEGGYTFNHGVWRPEEESVMMHNVGGFSAPAREAIYFRIHRLAYGDEWVFDWDDFVEWDSINMSHESGPEEDEVVSGSDACLESDLVILTEHPVTGGRILP